MNRLLEAVRNGRLVPLFLKELHQLRRNRRLVVMLIIPPTLQILLYGFALNPEVKNLRLGIADSSRTPQSRELISAFNESLSFRTLAHYPSANVLGRALSEGDLDLGLVIPKEFARKRVRGETAAVQILLDATNANTAAIAGGYAARVIGAYNRRALEGRRRVVVVPPAQPVTPEEAPGASGTLTPPPMFESAGGPPLARAAITPRIATFYNPGLETSWFITTGMIGMLLVLMGSLVSAASMVREKETGTIEQLLMTPAGASEIIIAKMSPPLLLLVIDIGIALAVCHLVFGVPLRGSLLLFFLAGVLCVFVGIGIGILFATFTQSQQQAQLLAFFVNPPIALLSGVMTPIEAMPKWLQPITLVNPVRHFATIARGVLLKGIGLDLLYPNILMLAAVAVLLVGFSVWHFRQQLG